MAKAKKKRTMKKRIVRRGQTKPTKRKGKKGLWYKKAGKWHKKSVSRDRKIKAKHTRSKSSPSWRGDVKGTRV